MQNMPWTKSLLDDFIAEAMLSDREIKLMKMRIHGDSVVKQSSGTIRQHFYCLSNGYRIT